MKECVAEDVLGQEGIVKNQEVDEENDLVVDVDSGKHTTDAVVLGPRVLSINVDVASDAIRRTRELLRSLGNPKVSTAK